MPRTAHQRLQHGDAVAVFGRCACNECTKKRDALGALRRAEDGASRVKRDNRSLRIVCSPPYVVEAVKALRAVETVEPSTVLVKACTADGCSGGAMRVGVGTAVCFHMACSRLTATRQKGSKRAARAVLQFRANGTTFLGTGADVQQWYVAQNSVADYVAILATANKFTISEHLLEPFIAYCKSNAQWLED